MFGDDLFFPVFVPVVLRDVGGTRFSSVGFLSVQGHTRGLRGGLGTASASLALMPGVSPAPEALDEDTLALPAGQQVQEVCVRGCVCRADADSTGVCGVETCSVAQVSAGVGGGHFLSPSFSALLSAALVEAGFEDDGVSVRVSVGACRFAVQVVGGNVFLHEALDAAAADLLFPRPPAVAVPATPAPADSEDQRLEALSIVLRREEPEVTVTELAVNVLTGLERCAHTEVTVAQEDPPGDGLAVYGPALGSTVGGSLVNEVLGALSRELVDGNMGGVGEEGVPGWPVGGFKGGTLPSLRLAERDLGLSCVLDARLARLAGDHNWHHIFRAFFALANEAGYEFSGLRRDLLVAGLGLVKDPRLRVKRFLLMFSALFGVGGRAHPNLHGLRAVDDALVHLLWARGGIFGHSQTAESKSKNESPAQ